MTITFALRLQAEERCMFPLDIYPGYYTPSYLRRMTRVRNRSWEIAWDFTTKKLNLQ
jgi:hypothetical protein